MLCQRQTRLMKTSTCLSFEDPPQTPLSAFNRRLNMNTVAERHQPVQTAPMPADWPEHYTERDILTCQCAHAWIEQKHYTRTAFARLARISLASLSQILSGKYPTSPAPLL